MERKTKLFVLALMGALILGTGTSVFAQNQGEPWGQTVTVEGSLELQNGVIVLVSGDTSYYVSRLNRYVGFIEDLKEGATLSVQGYPRGFNTLMPIAITVNGKSYDLASNGWGCGAGAGCGGGFAYGAGYRGRRHGRW